MVEQCIARKLVGQFLDLISDLSDPTILTEQQLVVFDAISEQISIHNRQSRNTVLHHSIINHMFGIRLTNELEAPKHGHSLATSEATSARPKCVNLFTPTNYKYGLLFRGSLSSDATCLHGASLLCSTELCFHAGC